jgi:hypothetical protein
VFCREDLSDGRRFAMTPNGQDDALVAPFHGAWATPEDP